MSKLSAWLQASRLPSQTYIFFPLLLGAGLFHWRSGLPIQPGHLLLAQLYGLFLQLYIVYANDYADAPSDGANTTYTPFSGGSRVIPQGKLSLGALRNAALLMAAANLLLGLGLFFWARRPLALPLILVSLLLLWMYSFPPFKLSYRGGGELLQVLGVGVVLPLMGYSMQAGDWGGFPWTWMLFLLPMNIAAAFTTTIPDTPSDKTSGKKTVSVLLGAGVVQKLVVGFYAVGLAGFIAFSGLPAARTLKISALPFVCWILLLPFSCNAAPGTRNCLLFVTLAVAVQVLWTATTAIYLLF